MTAEGALAQNESSVIANVETPGTVVPTVQSRPGWPCHRRVAPHGRPRVGDADAPGRHEAGPYAGCRSDGFILPARPACRALRPGVRRLDAALIFLRDLHAHALKLSFWPHGH